MMIRDNLLYSCIKTYILISHLNSHRDRSGEGSKHMVSVRHWKIYPLVFIKYPILSRALNVIHPVKLLNSYHQLNVITHRQLSFSSRM